MLINIKCSILILLLDIKATAPVIILKPIFWSIINDDWDCKLIATSSQYLFQVLPGIHIQLYRSEFSKGLPMEIRIQGNSLDTDFATEVLGRQLIHVARDFGDLFGALAADAEPGAF